MGFHIIVKAEKSNLISHYAEKFEDLVEYSDIQMDSIIYQGEPDWKPNIIGEHDIYKNLADEKFRAGIKAEKLFCKQANEHGLMLEKLSQDSESFKLYTTNADVQIKRGDFLIRNVRNIEVEIKCITLYKNEYFYINYNSIKKHENMQRFSCCPVIFAFYRRDGDSPVEDSLCMITVDKIIEENRKSDLYDKESKCLVVPVSLTQAGFILIDREREKIKIPGRDNLE